MEYSSDSDEDYGEDEMQISTFPEYNTKFKLAMCSLFHPKKHGFDENSSKDINEHYLCMEKISPYLLYTRGRGQLLCLWNSRWRDWNGQWALRIGKHPTIRNYDTICQRKGSHQLEIVRIIRKPPPGNEDICILQTFWLKIFQNVCRKRLERRKHLMRIKNLHNREIWGKSYKRYYN